MTLDSDHHKQNHQTMITTTTRQSNEGNTVTMLGGWGINCNEIQAGDIVNDEFALSKYGEPIQYSQLPVRSVDERDPGHDIPCAFCNDDTHVQERLGSSLKHSEEDILDITYERDGSTHTGVILNLDTNHPDGWQVVLVGGTAVPLNDVVEVGDEYDGIVKADYALVGTETLELHGFGCHACVQR
jgi:hypothetical protein